MAELPVTLYVSMIHQRACVTVQSRPDVPDDSGDVLDAGSADDLGGGDDTYKV